MDYLAPVIAQTIKEEIGSTERNLARMLFKLAVESVILSELQAAQFQLSDERMDALRQMCSRIVAENNGIITFEKAYATQHRDA